MATMAIPQERFRFDKTQRLRSRADFARVYAARIVKQAGPLRVFGCPNDLGFSRLGLSVSVRVGGAVTRNRVKRMLRESFRLLQHDLPRGYDWIVVVARHEPQALADYQRLLTSATQRLERQWHRPRQPNPSL